MTAFGLSYAVGFVGCAALVIVGINGMRGDGKNDYYATGLIPGVAGFSVFPFINVVIAVVLGLYVLFRPDSRREST